MARNLTEKQQKFLEVLFEEAQGNLSTARKLAGYSDNVATSQIVDSLEEEIADLTKKFLARSGTKAAYAMYQAMENPTDLGVKEKMAAAKDILDRGGFKATDKVEVKTDTPLFILPEKKEEG